MPIVTNRRNNNNANTHNDDGLSSTVASSAASAATTAVKKMAAAASVSNRRPRTFGWLRLAQQVVFLVAFALFKHGYTFMTFAAASEEGAGAASAEEESESGLPKEAQIVLAIILICLTAIFAGLTIGIMGADTLTLEIIAEGGNEPDASYARKLLPIRKLGHHALCTLVLGNMWANVMIAQFCADINPEEAGSGEGGAGGIIAFLMSTLIILIFGEILPMSVCKSSQALRIAAAGVPILKVFIVLLYPAAKPLGWALDKLIHHDPGQIYDRNELVELMKLHTTRLGEASGLDKDEGNLLIGALEFKEKNIASIMTSIDETICVSEDCLIDRELLKALWAVGRSRVPVVRGSCSAPVSIKDPRSLVTTAMKQDIIGILYIKDLITYNVPDTTVGQYLRTEQQREVRHVVTTDTLPKVMALAQTGVAHLFVVREPATGSLSLSPSSVASPSGAAYSAGASYLNNSPAVREVANPMLLGRVVGICTMEDVLEALIKSEIYDENDDLHADDEDGMVDDGAPVTGHTAAAVRRAKATRVNLYSFYIAPDAATKGPVEHVPLREVERNAIAKYLQNAVPAFAFWRIPAIRALLAEAKDDILMPVAAAAAAAGGASTPTTADGSPSSPLTSMLNDGNATTPSVSGSPYSAESFLSDVPAKNIVCRKGQQVLEFCLVLTGCVDVCFGTGDGFRSEVTTMGFLGESVLMDGTPFTPSFNARVSKRPTRLLRIPYALYQAHERRLQLASAAANFSNTFATRVATAGANNNTTAASSNTVPIVTRANPTGATPPPPLSATASAAPSRRVDGASLPRPQYVSRYATNYADDSSPHGGSRDTVASPTPLIK